MRIEKYLSMLQPYYPSLAHLTEEEGAAQRPSILTPLGLPQTEWTTLAVFHRALRVAVRCCEEELQDGHKEHSNADLKELLSTLLVSLYFVIAADLPISIPHTQI